MVRSRARSRARRPDAMRPALVGEDGDLHVLEHGQAREDVGALEGARQAEPADRVRRPPGDVAAAEIDAAGVRDQVPGDHVEQRGLARAVGADDRRDLAGLHTQAHSAQGLEAAEGPRHSVTSSSDLAVIAASIVEAIARPSARRRRQAAEETA